MAFSLTDVLLLSLPVTLLAQYTPVFFDDFSSGALDLTRWNVWNNRTHGDKEWQLYLADEVYVENKQLVIRTQARDVSYGSKLYHFSSG